MSTRRRRKEEPPRLPPLLVNLIHAAKHAQSDPIGRTGHDATLRDLALWAQVRVPSEGVLAPEGPRAFDTIEDIAKQHLPLGEARTAVKQALSTIDTFETRDAVESAYSHFQSVSDLAYYYAGLACGVTLMHPDASRW